MTEARNNKCAENARNPTQRNRKSTPKPHLNVIFPMSADHDHPIPYESHARGSQKDSVSKKWSNHVQGSNPRRHARTNRRAEIFPTAYKTPHIDTPSLDSITCPICVESFDEVEIRYFPCPCKYRVCAMCVHQIRQLADGKCPSCRDDYTSNGILQDQVDRGLLTLLRKVSAAAAGTQRIRERGHVKNVPMRQPSSKRLDGGRVSRGGQKVIEKTMPSAPPPPVPVVTPRQTSAIDSRPQIRLTRFSGGLSVWD